MRKVETKKFVRMLKKLGFDEVRHAKGAHVVYRHGETGLIASLPIARKELPPVFARAISRQIENYGIASRDKIEEMLEL
jgi:predicted RNA binding protein YcfA (HicA-like mRNA interferase family)